MLLGLPARLQRLERSDCVQVRRLSRALRSSLPARHSSLSDGGSEAGSVVALLLLLAFIPGAAFANYNLVYYLDIVTNYPGGSSYLIQQYNIKTNALWGLYDNFPTFNNAHTESLPDDGTYPVNFLTMNNYYVPAPNPGVFLNANKSLTNYYIPYSNILAVTVAGTNGMISNVVWSFSAPLGELTNSTAYKTAYTNNWTNTPIPTNNYTVAFPNVVGWATPSGVGTNINSGSPQTNNITGTYARVFGTITVTNISPTNGSWVFTAYPSDYYTTNSTTSALSGTNYATLTNVPGGVYTIHYNPLSGYGAPADETKTNTVGSSNLLFVGGTYTLGASALTVQFMPVEAQSAKWWVYDNTALQWHGPYVHNTTTNLTSSNDYTVYFSAVRGFKLPASTNLDDFVGDRILTNTYLPYSNSLAVTIYGLTTTTNVTWTLAGPGEFTNSANYGTNFTSTSTNTYTVAAIPTGNYAVTFPATLAGYTLSSANPSTNIVNSSPAVNSLTGGYTRLTGTIQVNVYPSNGSWAFISYPSDFTNYTSSALSGTNDATLTNTPVGSYTIQFLDLAGYELPTPSTVTKTNSSLVTTIFNGIYGSGWLLTVHVVTSADTNLAGLGTGSVAISPSNEAVQVGNETWQFSKVTEPAITITAIPAGTTNFFLKWAGDIGGANGYVNPLNVTMGQDRNINLYFSKAWNTNDHLGDIDGDGLPDVWELANELDPMSDKGDNGASGNPDLDFIPSSSTNPPWSVLVVTNLISYTGQSGDAGYPLLRTRLLSRGQVYYQADSLGYANGVPFNNILECRGMDPYYRTNTPPGMFAYTTSYGDDPMTDPRDADTDGDEMTDGWEFYFWYWRSANSYAAGITNSANLSWVQISPSIPRYNSPHDSSSDTDSDAGLNIGNDLYEFKNGYDPTHADTDGDGMDDYWEITSITPSAVSNALDSANWNLNPDNDYYAFSTNILVLRAGLQIGGTAFSTGSGSNVCYAGVATAPTAAWLNNYTTTGTNRFDLYLDTILLANPALTNRQTGAVYTNGTVFYGTNAGLGAFQQGYPVWVDMNNNSNYDAGDIAIVNPPLKHDAVYCMAPATPGPGVTMFHPQTAWATNELGPNTQPYNNYQEYLGGDYLGRVAWDAGGRVVAWNDVTPLVLRINYTEPNSNDTDTDLMEDGWELYVGLDPRSAADATADSDGDGLANLAEWANASCALGSTAATWPNKKWPTDPGFLTAPSPNDPHPKDTDFDGLVDGTLMPPSPIPYEKGEHDLLSNPTGSDTDADYLPDGWEVYAGTNPNTADETADSDGDGLLNWQEYWTGTVNEWQFCDPSWNLLFFSRRMMDWDDPSDLVQWFIPPDFLTDPSFLYNNFSSDGNFFGNLGWLRTNYPAASAYGHLYYHTTWASTSNAWNNAGPIGNFIRPFDPTDSDGDGMDDYWEIYHGLNPCHGYMSMMWMFGFISPRPIPNADIVDADTTTLGYQVGTVGHPFNSGTNLVWYMRNNINRLNAATPDAASLANFVAIKGPHNFGLDGMDPDADGLLNFEEYSYYWDRAGYHTDPSPFWRTDEGDTGSFVNQCYGADRVSRSLLFFYVWTLGPLGASAWTTAGYPFKFEMVEGFDTDNDGIGDYDEINNTTESLGTDPLSSRNPIRNRALYLDGATGFARTLRSWSPYWNDSLTRFTVEAWVKPDRVVHSTDQVIVEKGSGNYTVETPGGPTTVFRANFRLGINTTGQPFIMYNGRNATNTYQATARLSARLKGGEWAHLAGVYDGANLTIYVNGEAQNVLRTTELPANGTAGASPYDVANSIILGAHDLHGEYFAEASSIDTRLHYAGCVDEVRIWNTARTQAEIIAAKNRRLSASEINTSIPDEWDYREGTNNIYAYYTFDDVPDPNYAGEAIVPAHFNDLNINYHPMILWWATHAQRSTVYTGGTGQRYDYIVFADDLVKRQPRWPPLDNKVIIDNLICGTPISATNTPPEGYRNTANPYNPMYHAACWNFMADLCLFNTARSVATNSWLDGLDPNNPDSTDTDGDGMPDWWEQLYGLNPNDATGDNGAWGDPDHDGLNNRAEYLAGTDPFNSDTAGDGIGDYDSPRGVYSRTYGEMFTDGDGMPDVWESQNGLDPQKYDANLDLDGDGWSNYAEYQAGTDPNDVTSHPAPIFGGHINQAGNLTNGPCLISAYQTNTMDGIPSASGATGQGGAPITAYESLGRGDGTRKIYSGQLQHGYIVKGSVRVIRFSHMWVCPDYDFGDDADGNWVLFTSYTASVPANDYVQFDYISGTYTFTWPTGSPNNWGAPWNGDVITIQYQWQNVSADTFQVTGIKEGDVYLWGFRDVNNNGTWDPNEPQGVAEDQPFYMNWSTPGNMEINLGLADALPGYGRFTWTGIAVTSSYNIVINRISESGAPTILTRSMIWPRNVFHEWDYQIQGIYGLMAGTYQWWMGSQNGTFSVNWPASLATPGIVYPRGETLYYAQNNLMWTMDNNSTRYHLQVARQATDGGLAFVVNDYFTAPYLRRDGQYRDRFPYYTSELGNGVYYWRVAGWTPQGESAWSDVQTFNVNLSATNSRSVSGDIYYFGKAPATKIIVEAYENQGFSGWPLARMTLTPSASTGWEKCSYTLRGLEQGFYYVRAFLDVTPAGSTEPDGNPDAWESAGFYRDPNDFYKTGRVNLTDAQFVDDAKIIIRDRDTDNDSLPDAWEMAYFGNLDQTGEMDFDGDGETNLEEYMHDGINLIPSAWDSDGDGLSDAFEMNYNGAVFGFAGSARAVDTVLHPTTWDTDGDGYSDGAELIRYRTDPLDPASYPRYRPLCTDAWSSPGDYDGDGRSDVAVYDSNAGSWSFITMAGQSRDMPFGVTYAQPLVGDYTGDNCSEFAFYDNGLWSLYTLSGQSATMQLGDASMLPVSADYTGDGRVDLAVYDTDNGTWYIYDVWSGALISGRFGASGMIPVPGDYNGDGAADLAVYEPATGDWMLGCYHKYYRTWTTFAGTLGGPTWMPVPGDYDGDGRNDVCLFEGATGRWMLFTLAGQFAQGIFGWQGCMPVPGDYDGDGRTDLGLYDMNTGMWYINCISGAYFEGCFGWPGVSPITKGR